MLKVRFRYILALIFVFMLQALAMGVEAERDTPTMPAHIPDMFSYGCWIEAESIVGTSQTNFNQRIISEDGSEKSKKEVVYSANGALSAGGLTLPKEGKFFARYDFELPAKDSYILWYRGSRLDWQRWRSSFYWSVDNLPFRDTTGFQGTREGKTVWVKLGTLVLGKGKHQLTVEVREDNRCIKYGYSVHLDAFAFVSWSKSGWLPLGVSYPPAGPERKNIPVYRDMWECYRGVLTSESSPGAMATIHYKDSPSFATVPEKMSVLLKANDPANTKCYAIFKDDLGLLFGIRVAKSLGYHYYGYFECSPREFMQKGGEYLLWGVDEPNFPIKFEGLLFFFRNSGFQRIEIDNLFIDNLLLDDFEDTEKWSSSDCKFVSTSTGIGEEGKFYVDREVIYLASELACLTDFEYIGYFQRPPVDIRLQLDLPSGMEIINRPASSKREAITSLGKIFLEKRGKVIHRERNFDRYWLYTQLGFGYGSEEEDYPPLRLGLKTSLPAGTKTSFFTKTLWKGGSSQEVEKPVEVLEAKKVEPSERFLTGIAGVPVKDVPDDFFWNMGLKGRHKSTKLSPEVIAKAGLTHIGYGGYYGNEPDATKREAFLAQTAALDIDGKRIGHGENIVFCPSYRGEYLKKSIENSKKLAEVGLRRFHMGSELFVKADRVCFCPRCLAKFKGFMAEKYPEIKYADPKIFARQPKKYPKLMDCWWDFKLQQFADLLKIKKDAISKEIIKQGGKPLSYYGQSIGVTPWSIDKDAVPGEFINPQTGKPYEWSVYYDYKRLGKFMDVLSNQVFICGDESSLGKEILHERLLTGEESNCIIAPEFMGPYSAFWQKQGNKWFGTHKKSIKSQMLEMFANGAKGMFLFMEGSCTGLDVQCITEAIRIAKKVESIIMEGKPLGVRNTTFKADNPELRVSGIECGGEYFLIVANYDKGYKKVEGKIVYTGKKSLKVIDLDRDKEVAKLSASKNEFTVSIEGSWDRIKAFHIR